ncbi:leucine-rich repeat protein, partial [Parabacteroides sp. OttesenSCG-928-K15]|nr:leucine-rich repeat protein [Parabacteroides sp. OttesenSCG-928-K15]
MKKRMILSMFAAAALWATSCNVSEEIMFQTGGSEVVTFTAHIGDGMKTRALDATDEAISRALLEIYDADGELVGSRITGDINGDKITFSAQLESGSNYSCLFWADGGSDAYNVDNFKAIAPGTTPSIAYYAKEDITAAAATTQSVTLEHAVAKVVLDESGTLTAGDKVGVSFSLPAYTFNVTDGSCTAGTTGTISKEFTIGASLLTGEVGSFYQFAPADGTSPVTMTLSYTPILDSNKETHAIPNVPLKRNFRTVLRGAFEEMDVTTQHSFNVSLDKNWNEEIHSNQTVLTITAEGELKADPSLIDNAISPKGSLVLQGPVNKSDIWAIGKWARQSENEGKLKTVDLSGVTGLTMLDHASFSGVSSLSSIILPESLEQIGQIAFSGTSLESIVIPNSVTSIGYHAFASCSKLKTVKLSDNLIRIEEGAFNKDSLLTEITLPDNLQYLGNNAFFETNLSKIEIPATIELIGD